MNILVGCEESQRVCIEFRKRRHIAFSCDLQPCSGGKPEWHLQMDVFEATKGGKLKTQAGNIINIKKWDMGLFFPDCTFLTVSGNKWLKDQPPRKSGKLVGKARRDARAKAIDFFMRLVNCAIPKIAIENPVGCMSTWYRKPDQIIQPYNFGSDASKKTCLWLNNLPKLINTKYIPPRITKEGKKRWANQSDKDGSNILPPSKDRAKLRSKTYPGVAKAMAEQWSTNINLDYLIYF